MIYREICPGEKLKPFIKCYFILSSDGHEAFSDTLFPGGNVEIVFNLGEAKWQSALGDLFNIDPPVELLGQFTQPLKIKTRGKSRILGIRFHTHAAAYFFKGSLSDFSNQISDLGNIAGASIPYLHQQLLETTPLNLQIKLIEDYLVRHLSRVELNSPKLFMLENIVKDMQCDPSGNIMDAITSKYRITPRYLQKLFVQYIGVTPKFYSRINRFRESLQQLKRNTASLTSIAYECGYYDQAHFIKEFRSFTGSTPSQFQVIQVGNY